MSPLAHVLVVGSNTHACAWSTALMDHGYDVEMVVDVTTARLQLADVFVLGVGSVELCRYIRAGSKAPVIAVSPGDEAPVAADMLDAGADQCVVMPIGIKELMARIRALLRRWRLDDAYSAFAVGDVHVDLKVRRVQVGGTEVRLTPKQFDLFLYMIRHERLALSHRTLLKEVWGEAHVDQHAYLRVLMGQLRKKIEPEPANPRYLRTERSLGYVFTPHEEPSAQGVTEYRSSAQS